METFAALLCEGKSQVAGELQRPVTRSVDIFFDLCLNKRLRNYGDTGDLRRHCANDDVTVMISDVLSVDGIGDYGLLIDCLSGIDPLFT